MAKRKTNNQSELLEFLSQKLNLRRNFDRNAWNVIQNYAEKGDTAKLSLLKGLLIELEGRTPEQILSNLDIVDYQTDVKGSCVCGKSLSKELYRLRIGGRLPKKALEREVVQTISTGETVGESRAELTLGSSCYANLPELLSDLGYPELQEVAKKSKKKKADELEHLIEEPSKELLSRLKAEGIDIKQFEKISSLLQNADLTNEREVIFNLDPGRKNSFANWFSQGIKQGAIIEQEIIDIYSKLEKASHLIQPGELAKLATYSYEYRKFPARAVIGIDKDDLMYLSNLSDNDPIVKEHGKFNIDKHYVRPGTKFRNRKDLEKVTIREKLNQSHLTFLEALGIQLHFPELRDVREQANRKTAGKYGVSQIWYWLLRNDIKPVFEQTKKELHEEYKEFGEIVHDHVLTKDEYHTVKEFLKRGSLGRKSERESYLRMHSIQQFQKIAPKIAAIGRKLRLAEKMHENGNGIHDYGILKQEYILKEDFEENQEKLVGTSINLENILDMLEIVSMQRKPYKRLQKEIPLIRQMYAHGLISKKYTKSGKNTLKSWLDYFKEKGITLEKIAGNSDIKTLREAVVKIREHSGYLIADDDKELLKYSSVKVVTHGNKEISYLDSRESLEMAEKMSSCTKMDAKTKKKLDALNELRVYKRITGEYPSFLNLPTEGKPILLTERAREKINQLYEANRVFIEEELPAIDKKRARIEKEIGMEKRMENFSEFETAYRKLDTFFERYPGMRAELANPEVERELSIYKSLKAWRHGYAFGNVKDVKKFDLEKNKGELAKQILSKYNPRSYS